jgi:hypothetical protein
MSVVKMTAATVLLAGVCVVLAGRTSVNRNPRESSGRPVLEGDRKEGTPVYSKSGYDMTPLSKKQIAELARTLSPDERRILLDKDTERPFCGALLNNKEPGIYVCRLCGLPLFRSKAKTGHGLPGCATA